MRFPSRSARSGGGTLSVLTPGSRAVAAHRVVEVGGSASRTDDGASLDVPRIRNCKRADQNCWRGSPCVDRRWRESLSISHRCARRHRRRRVLRVVDLRTTLAQPLLVRQLMSHRRPEGLTPPLWFAAQFGTLLLLGPILATLVAGIGAATRHIIQGHRFVPGLVSTATVMVATLASGLLFKRFGGMPRQFELEFEWVWQTLLVAATVTGYCAVKAVLTSPRGRSRCGRSIDRGCRRPSATCGGARSALAQPC